MPNMKDWECSYNPTDTPDARPGFYYVSVIDGPKFGLLSGPYSTHAEALAQVEPARKIAHKANRDAIWYGFGTCRLETSAGPGVLQRAGLLGGAESSQA